ncbi:GlxA family transcriptional regulator [Cupriavidus pinatubonensis]|uniref:GlxA family transcriptional regulator n=1 Tax=Cupriavidus pinatubonensis TaxID=248026 RepID=UPI00112A3EA9|nr:GlxA family transcriptional regulator [Cupriavidus pinatubonensis]TPQ39256.1 AraC family transcriptional regulator [Cupriavidus pinatubonensis]
MKTAAVLVFPEVQGLDVSGPLDVFAEANRFLSSEDQYSFEILGTEPGRIRCSNGLEIHPDRLFSESNGAYELLLIAGGPTLPQQTFAPSLYAWIRSASVNSACICTICNGTFLLARAGVLDGKHVTTHWNDAASLARECPTAVVSPDRLYIQDGNLVTSAGVTAGIDMSLYLLARDHGREVAIQVAKQLLLFTHRAGGQSQFSPYLNTSVEPSSLVSRVHEYVFANLTADLSLNVLANVARMSVRHFTRIFMRESNISVMDFVEAVRLDAARSLLETTSRPIKAIAYECGFSTAHRMRSVFRRNLGISPQDYRAHFLDPASGSRQLPDFPARDQKNHRHTLINA